MKTTFTLLIALLMIFFSSAQNCDHWLKINKPFDAVELGDLDITGSKMTIEASFNATGDITRTLVSKHVDPNDVNYHLLPDLAQITTTNGFFFITAPCDFIKNKTYHAAMVYDGATLKLYRNGFLMGSVPATGDLITNDWPTAIGENAYAALNQTIANSHPLEGFINEVRIWNVVRTQAQIRTYMNTSLPNPATQTGLLAYFIFDNLLNKQGNTTFNGILKGTAAINATNTSCAFVADSCARVQTDPGIGDIINTYTPITAFNPCDNKVTVQDAATFNIGDTVLMIQMKGALVDSNNTATFGNILNYKNAGNYEFNYVKSKTGNIIELKNAITRQYDVPFGKVQLIRVPYYGTANITSPLTCLPWDGEKGGVLVLNAEGSVTLNADIDVTGKGFRGGNSVNPQSSTLYCGENGYTYPAGLVSAAAKGEGIALISDDFAWGKGASANAGGGGVGHNSGGGGGSNGGIGGLGGYQLQSCGNAPFDNRGLGGNSLVYDNIQNKIFMGGGGGSGHTDNAAGSDMNGGNGGGIVIINSNSIDANGHSIFAKGGDAPQCSSSVNNCHDGSGGGGGGGAILINNSIYTTAALLNVAGGKGADLAIFDSAAGAGRIGPGGGGGAGITWLNNVSLPANVNTILTGGVNGVIPADNNNPWGATPGNEGKNFFGLKMPFDIVPFENNIDSVTIKDTARSCALYDFKGLAFTKGSGITNWQWNFGDGSTADVQNVSHSYAGPGTYIVQLLASDINGCKDSATVTVIYSGPDADFSYKQDVCNPLSIQFSSFGAMPVNPLWLFGDGSNTAGDVNPTHSYATPGIYPVKYVIQNGTCADTITKNILIRVIDEDIITSRDTTICFNTQKQLLTRPALNFCWTPTTYLDNPLAANPVTTTPGPITYYFTAEIMGDNLIVNGDFSAGNTGFTSQYTFADPTLTEAQYFIGTNPQAWSPLLSPCGDHTTGNGKMMLVNGAPVPNIEVWKETVTVTPNTNYAFSTWIAAMYPPNPAQLTFSINGRQVGNVITTTLPTCNWTQFYTTWNSGNNTSASISVINKNTAVEGNDFVLDDMSFATVLIKRDSIKITIDTAVVKTIADTATCVKNAVQLNATGGNTYSWSPASGLNNAGIVNPLATPDVTTQYIVTGINERGCSATDTVNIFVKPSPVIIKSADSTICHNLPIQLFASGGNKYSWSPSASLNNATIAAPVASPTVNTTYFVTVTAANSCSKTDSIKIAIRPQPVFSITPDKATCVNTNVGISASGGTSYLWSPAALVSDPFSSSPVTNTNTTTTYFVKIKDNVCNDSVTLSTRLIVSPVPVVNILKSNDIDCAHSSSQLIASGANQYVWSPATGLSNSNTSNPVVSITAPQQYTVTGTDTSTKCSGTASVTILIKPPFDPVFFVPTAFSPNGDGRNDCFRVDHYGTVKSVDFSIYNRWGNMVFHTSNIDDCWDGLYKGSPSDPGNYVYYIKTFNDCGQKMKKGNIVLIR